MPLRDREITLSASCALATFGWVAALAMWLTSWWQDDVHMGQLSLILTAAAVTATIRCYFFSVNRIVRNAVRASELDRKLVCVPKDSR